MSNPLSHVGQTARPETSEQAQQQQQKPPQPGDGQSQGQQATPAAEPPPTHLPQHPQQQQGAPGELSTDEQQRVSQQSETDNEDELRHESPV